jgi:hypothetical protein
MADLDQDAPPALESKASPEQRSQAESMGWIPPERFTGDPEKFVDADAYIERGEHVLPIVQARNRELSAQVRSTNEKVAQLDRALKESQETITALEEFHTAETARRVKETRETLLSQLKAAKTEGNIDAEVEVTDALTRLNAAEDASEGEGGGKKPTPAAEPAREAPKLHPDWEPWLSANPWFGQDEVKTSLVTGFATKLRKDPANDGLLGKAFYDECLKRANTVLNGASRVREDRVSDSRPGAGTRTGSTKRFSDLPAEARAACHEFSSKLVGPGKRHKTLDAWEAAYTKQYLAGESQ